MGICEYGPSGDVMQVTRDSLLLLFAAYGVAPDGRLLNESEVAMKIETFQEACPPRTFSITDLTEQDARNLLKRLEDETVDPGQIGVRLRSQLADALRE